MSTQTIHSEPATERHSTLRIQHGAIHSCVGIWEKSIESDGGAAVTARKNMVCISVSPEDSGSEARVSASRYQYQSYGIAAFG